MRRIPLGRRPANEEESRGEIVRWRAQLNARFPTPYGAAWEIKRQVIAVYDEDSEECQLWIQRVKSNLPQEWELA